MGKCEDEAMNKRINKHRGNAKKADSISVDKHFLLPGHDFNRDFTNSPSPECINTLPLLEVDSKSLVFAHVQMGQLEGVSS